MSYSDPSNVDELIAEFNAIKHRDFLREFIDKHLPNWLITSSDSYTIDYPHLQVNWEHICAKNEVEPQKIIAVEKIVFEKKQDESKYKLLSAICEKLTRMGYVIRRREELTSCRVCRKAMPTKEIWQLMLGHNMIVPKVYNTVCSACESNKKTTLKNE